MKRLLAIALFLVATPAMAQQLYVPRRADAATNPTGTCVNTTNYYETDTQKLWCCVNAAWVHCGSTALDARTLTAGAGLSGGGTLAADRSFATASDEESFLLDGALTCGASTKGKMKVHTTPLQYCDNSGTPTLRYSAYGDNTGLATGLVDGVALGEILDDDGAGSLLDADFLDGIDSLSFPLGGGNGNPECVAVWLDTQEIGCASELSVTGGDLVLSGGGDVIINGNTAWHSANDGTGSTLDADLLDGVNSTSFVRDTGNESIAGIKTFTDAPVISINNTPGDFVAGLMLDTSNTATVTNQRYPAPVFELRASGWDDDGVVADDSSFKITHEALDGNDVMGLTKLQVGFPGDEETLLILDETNLNVEVGVGVGFLAGNVTATGAVIQGNDASDAITVNGNVTTSGDSKLNNTASDVTLTQATEDDLAIGDGIWFRVSGAGQAIITSLATPAAGRYIRLTNVGTPSWALINQSATGTAANRIITGTDADLTIKAGKTVELIYDGTTSRWRVISASMGDTEVVLMSAYPNALLVTNTVYAGVRPRSDSYAPDFNIGMIRRITGYISTTGDTGSVTFEIVDAANGDAVVCSFSIGCGESGVFQDATCNSGTGLIPDDDPNLVLRTQNAADCSTYPTVKNMQVTMTY